MANKPTYEELEQRVKELEEEATERKETEEGLQESKRLAELLLDCLPHPAMLIRSDRTVLIANRIAKEVGAKVGGYCWRDFGQSNFIPEMDKEYIHQHKQIPPGGTGCYFCKADEALKNKCQIQNEVNAWDKVWDANWIPLGEDRYLHFVIDITERKKAEAILRKNEEKYRRLVEESADGIAIVKGLEIRLVNRALLGIYGCQNEDEMVGYTFTEFVSPEYRKLMVERGLAPEKGQEVTGHYEFKGLRKDGTEFDAEISVSSIIYEEGVARQGIIRDVTERKRAEAERLEMERRLLHAQKLESLGVLARGIAHDFNNLLTAILGNLDIALLNLSPISRSRHNIEQAILASRRATDLTQQMLVYSGKGQLVVGNIDLSELVKENTYLFRASISKAATLNLHLVSNLPTIMADPEQVQQVIMNLITNASEALGGEAGVISLTTGVQECDEAYFKGSRIEEKPLPGNYVYVEVSDTGCGMEEEVSQRLFDPFFTTKSTGRGLGMSAVQGIVRRHKGAIFVDSGAGKGTTIRVLFPVSETAKRGRAELNEAEGLRSGEADRTSVSGTVLVVDDEEMVCGLCKGMLEYLGFHVFTAADGQEALDVFQKHADEVVCVILDLTMPRMDGVATFKELRRIRPDVRVILSSGYNEEDATRRFVGEDLSGFIQKPYRLQDLRGKIDRVLKLK